MATVDKITDQNLPDTAFYAPAFRIEVSGKELTPETLREITDVKVSLDREKLGGFDFTIGNPWHYKDPEVTFKYSDSKLFDLGNLVHVYMGYADDLKLMIAGIITKISPKFPESGPPTLSIHGEDNLVKLRDKKAGKGDVKYWTNKSDSEVAQAIAARNKIPIDVDPIATKRPIIVQRNQDEASLLMELAARNDYDCYVHEDPKTKKDTLVFKKPTDGRASTSRNTYVFEWGKSLVSFTPTLTVNRQWSKVTVRGWDPTTKSKIEYTATKADLEGKKTGTSGPAVVEDKLAKKEETVLDCPVQTQEEAKNLAIAMLRERAYEFATASGSSIGLPDMRPGDNVQIKGVGQRFSGDYYVSSCEHAIGNNGYATTFNVRRSFDGGTKDK